MLTSIAGLAKGLRKPTLPLQGEWTRIPASDYVPRSSHSLSIIKGRAYIFGGEHGTEQLVDNAIHVFTLPSSSVAEADHKVILARPAKVGGEVPAPRLGHTASVVGDRIYIFGGRGAGDSLLEEDGRVWFFDTLTARWGHLDPLPDTPFPPGRSYHAAAANEHPLPNALNSSGDGTSPLPPHHGTLLVHAGRPATGERLNDLWSFDIPSLTWARLADAPGLPRGGPSLVFAQNRLYRFGGFDGESEIGGSVDTLDFAVSTFDDQSGTGDMALTPLSDGWESLKPPASSDDALVPGPRSVAAMHALTTGQGRSYLVVYGGERSPSDGNNADGQFWNDAWSFQLKPEGMTAASFKDAARMTTGYETGERKWDRVRIGKEIDGIFQEGDTDGPGGPGWFASANMDIDPAAMVLWGGVNEQNGRLGDGWMLTVA
ncbi:MAG: hypothetical protein M4579_003997 [Chaenotheca gracillima]|nr:MAG: hypothetical protein M4579_003997 [Chaenotheca gracillima]